MSYSRTEPMFYLVDFRGIKAGTPVSAVKRRNIAACKLLAAKGIIGTASQLAEESPVEPKPVVEPKVEVKVEEPKVEETTVEPTEMVSVEKEEKPKQAPRKSRKKKS